MSCIITCPPYMIEPMQGGEILCTLKGIEKRYFSKGEPVLGPLDLTVRSGEILGLRGHNGAGKSTTLRAISGLIPAASGSISLGGKDGTIKGAFPLQTTMALCCRCRGLAMCRRNFHCMKA